MNEKNVVLLIDSMFSGCNETQKSKLASLYKEAYSNTDEFKKLVSLLNDYDFYGSIGQDLFNRGKEAVTEGLTQAGNFTKNLSVIEYIISNATSLSNETNEYIDTFSCYAKELYVIKKEKSSMLKVFLIELMNVFCYSVAILYGVNYLKDIKFDINASSIDMLKNVTTECSNVLIELNGAKKPNAWRIVRKQFGGANLIKYDGFSLEFVNDQDFMYNDQYEKSTPYIYVPKKSCDVLCYGIGNVSNLKVQNGISLIGGSVVTRFADNIFDDLSLDYHNMNFVNVINNVSKSNICVISPYDLVEILNRYFLMQTVKNRNIKQVCAYCGHANCNHFDIPENFSINAN